MKSKLSIGDRVKFSKHYLSSWQNGRHRVNEENWRGIVSDIFYPRGNLIVVYVNWDNGAATRQVIQNLEKI